ncbi:unnamed protein product, partial [Rotaria magnacalcarata]
QQQQHLSPRKRKLSPEETQSVKKKPQASTIDSEGFKIPPPPTLQPSSSILSSVGRSKSDSDHLNTVFVANLPFEVEDDAI